jgi:hypothetical protein
MFTDDTSRLPRYEWLLRWIGGLVIVTSLGLGIWTDIDRVFYERWPDRLDEKYRQWDALFRSGEKPGRGVFLKFAGFPKSAGGFTGNVYFRAVYALYPEPVVIAGPGVVVNDTMQILNGNSIPEDQALRDRGVGSVVVLRVAGMRPVIERVKWLDE